MNPDYASHPDTAAEALGRVAGEAVERMRAVPAPRESVTRIIERAAAWSDVADMAAPGRAHPEERPVQRRSPWWALKVPAAIVFISIAVGTSAYWVSRPRPAGDVNVKNAKDEPRPGNGTPGQGIGSPAPARQAGTSPSRRLAVAGDATILVSTGGAKPISLGDQQAYDANTTVHVWDWSKADASRPLAVSVSTGMAVSPDGKWIVTADGRLVDAATGQVKHLENFEGQVRGLRFSPDGRALLLLIYRGKANPRPGEGAIARVLDFPSGKKRVDIEGQWPFTFACAFTPDGGQFFLMDKDQLMRRWDVKTGENFARYEPAFTNSIRAVAVSPDARQVAGAGTRGDIHVWELASGKLLHTLVTEQPGLTVLAGLDSLAFSPDAKLLAGGSSLKLVLWETASGRVARSLPPQSGGAVHVRFSKDGKKLTTVRDFYGTNGRGGEDLLTYPEVREWTVGSAEEMPLRR